MSEDRLRTKQASGSGWKRREPDIDERLAPPETRIEYLEGVELFAAPADEPHARSHFDLVALLGAYTRQGYRGAVDMLSRVEETSDIAPDASIYPDDPDLVTGGRKLEELAFEVASEQRLAVTTRKARLLDTRGVRRVFCILPKKQRVLEWSRELDGWKTLSLDSTIEDEALAAPLPIRCLLDAADRDDAMARALLARSIPVLEQTLEEREARGEVRGRLEAMRRALGAVLRSRGIELDDIAGDRIIRCDDPETLGRWLELAARADRAGDIFGVEP